MAKLEFCPTPDSELYCSQSVSIIRVPVALEGSWQWNMSVVFVPAERVCGCISVKDAGFDWLLAQAVPVTVTWLGTSPNVIER